MRTPTSRPVPPLPLPPSPPSSSPLVHSHSAIQDGGAPPGDARLPLRAPGHPPLARRTHPPLNPRELLPDPQYVYQIPPSATHAGHRADSWNVEKWLRAVRVKVTSRGSKGAIKLEDKDSGELFAECPLPNDAPVSTAVEPVIDSSRYFVLRVVDDASGRHAFLGLGFRERDHAIGL